MFDTGIKELPLISEANLKGKIVLIRVDHNVVKKGIIHDPYRIDATIGTLYHICAKGGKIIIMTHVGRPKNKKTGEINISDYTAVMPIVKYLEEKLHIKLKVPEFSIRGNKGYEGIETSVNHMIRELKEDKIDGIYLPNTRWFNGEEGSEEDADKFANQLAGLADVYVNDAFGSWQAHASTTLVSKYMPSYAGFLMQKELSNLKRIFTPKLPFVAVVAGAKFDTKVNSLTALIKKADHLVLGGVIYNAYLCAKYNIKIQGISDDDILVAKKFIEDSIDYKDKIIELPYIVEAPSLDTKDEASCKVIDIRELKEGSKLDFILDVSARSFQEENVRKVFSEAKSIFVNAVMGYTPYFNEGTIALDSLIDENRDAVKLYGGGDTMQELKRLLPGLYIVALDSPNYYIFTGGGAVLKAIEGGSAKNLAPVKCLIRNKNSFQ